MNLSDETTAAALTAADLTPRVLDAPALAVDTLPADQADDSAAADSAPAAAAAADASDALPAVMLPQESPADALLRLVTTNLPPEPPLADQVTVADLRAVFVPIIAFMRSVELATHVPVVYAQPGTPPADQGRDGDLWVSEDLGELYIKQDGGWRASTRLRGLDGYTPVKGVDYVDRAMLDAYAQELKNSVVAEVQQALGTTPPPAEAAPVADPVPATPSVPAEVLALPYAPTTALPAGAFLQTFWSGQLVGGQPLTTSGAPIVIARITRDDASRELTYSAQQADGSTATYRLAFIDNVADVNIPLPQGAGSLQLVGSGAINASLQGYFPLSSTQTAAAPSPDSEQELNDGLLLPTTPVSA